MGGSNLFADDVERFGWEEAVDRRPETAPRPCVFISYRHEALDSGIAENVDRLLRRLGLDTYFDRQDRCVNEADRAGSDEGVATCLEIALDRSTALLGVTTKNTFKSAWPPYEIGSARGRKKFFPDAAGFGSHSPLIAHLIHRDVHQVPAFVKLGVPILDWDGLTSWAKFLMAMHRKPLDTSESEARAPRDLKNLEDALLQWRDPGTVVFERR